MRLKKQRERNNPTAHFLWQRFIAGNELHAPQGAFASPGRRPEKHSLQARLNDYPE